MDRARVAPKSIPFHLLEEITDGFSDDNKLGVGAYGSVYKGLSKDGEKVAVKKLHDHMARVNDELFEKEYYNLACLEHQNIVRLVGYCNETRKEYITFDGRMVLSEIPHLALCFEYMCKGSLANYLQDESAGEDWHVRYAIIKGICKGLKYLHEELNPPVYHLDLKPDNILLDEKMTAKIADFGLSKLFGDERTRVSASPIGTIGYLPPEYINRQVVSNKLDIFSLGVIIIKLMTGCDGYSQTADLPSEEFIELIHGKWRKRLQQQSSDAVESDAEQVKTCISIALRCVEEDRHKRPKIGDIVIELDHTETRARFSRAITINRGLTAVEEEEVVDFPSIQDNKQCAISDDSSQSGTAHVQVNDEEPTVALPNPGTTSLSEPTELTGGDEKIFRQVFSVPPNEQLRKSYACYLSTSVGPVMGVMYISTARVTFCSDSPLAYKAAGGDSTEWSYYKVAIPLHRLRAANPTASNLKPAEKYIQLVSEENHEFWLMGFVNYNGAVMDLQEALSGFHNLQA